MIKLQTCALGETKSKTSEEGKIRKEKHSYLGKTLNWTKKSFYKNVGGDPKQMIADAY